MSAQDYTKWHLPEGAKARLGKGYINEIAYSPDSSRLAIASSIGIWIYDADTGEELALFRGHIGPVERLSYSPDGRFIASSSADRSVRLWDAVTGEQKAILNQDNTVSNFVYSPDGSTITTNTQGKVCLWNAVTGEQKATLTERLYNNWFFSVAYSLDGSTIAIKPYHEICLWDAVTGEQKATITGESFVYSPDGSTIATLSNEEVCLWNAVTGEYQVTLAEHTGGFNDFAYSPDGKTVAAEGNKRYIYLWDTITGELKATLMGESFAYSPDGGTIATEGQQGICLWDAVTGEYKTNLATDADINHLGRSNYGSLLEYSPDGGTIAAWIPFADTPDGLAAMVCLWDAATGEHKVSELDGTGGFEYISDGTTIAIKSGDMTLTYLRDAATGKQKATLEHKITFIDDFITFQYSPDGKTIASKSSKEVYLWDTGTAERKATITGHTRSVFSVAYSPNGKTIATRNGTGEDLQDAVTGISLWDTGTTERKVTIAEHPCYVFTYSPGQQHNHYLRYAW